MPLKQFCTFICHELIFPVIFDVGINIGDSVFDNNEELEKEKQILCK